MKNSKISALLLVTGMLLAGNAWSSQAGRVQFVHGKVDVTSAAGATRRMHKGDAVNEGDTITSARHASAQIRMDDGGFIAVRQETRMKIDKFEFSKKPNKPQRSFFSLLKGGFRAITGLIGHIRHKDYRISTPAATIGIRGTDHEVVYVPHALPGVPSGTYDKVNMGQTTITTRRGTIHIMPNQMGFVGGPNEVPKLRPINTHLFTVVPPPAPHSNSNGGGGSGNSNNGGTGDRATAVVDTTAEASSGGDTTSSTGGTTTTTTTVLTTTTPQTQVINPTVALGGSLPAWPYTYGHEVIAPVLVTGSSYYDLLNQFSDATLALSNTEFQLDSLNNLTSANDGHYTDPNHYSVYYAAVTFSGGTPLDTWKAADGSVYLGRWQGGNINVTDTSATSPVAPFSVALGPASAHWLINANPPPGYVQTLAGTYSYNLVAATHPTDPAGHVGTLSSATLTADFTNQLVNMTLGINFSNKSLSVNGTGVSISGETAWTSSGSASCTGSGCDSGGYPYADLWARFAGDKAATASLAYNVYGGTTDLIQGVAALVTGTTPTTVVPVTTAAFVNNDITYAFAAVFGNQTATGPSSNVTPLTSPTSMTGSYNYCNNCSILSWTLNALTGGTSTSNSDPTTGINWGVWTGLTSATYSVTAGPSGYTGTTGVISNPGPIAWINGPATSFYMPISQTGTASYGSLGGVATDGTATYNVTSGSLNVDFARQLVTSLNLTIGTVGAGTLATISGSNAPLGGGPSNAGFYFCTAGTGCTGGQNGVLTATNAAGGTYDGSLGGALTGGSLTGAILSFNLYGSSTTPPQSPPFSLSGVAAMTLSTGTINASAQYQAALSSMAMIPSVPYPNQSYPYPVTQDTVSGNLFSPSSLATDANGNPTKWQDNNNNALTDNLGIVGASTVTITGATPYDHGTDATSGISWGRWSGGSIKYVSLVNNNAVTISNTPGGLHWLLFPATSGPMNLPVSGTFNYTLAGATRPTDQAGNMGTLNSATLTANFTAMTVNVGANVTVSGTTFNGSATGVPIQQGTYFEAGNGVGTQIGTLTCTGCAAGAVNSGHIVGAFTQNGIGAGVSYGFETGPSAGSPTKVISGVAAFHR